MFHPKFANDLVPFTWLTPKTVEIETRLAGWRPMGVMLCASAPYSERELVGFRRIWLQACALAHSTPLLPYPSALVSQEQGVVLTDRGAK